MHRLRNRLLVLLPLLATPFFAAAAAAHDPGEIGGDPERRLDRFERLFDHRTLPAARLADALELTREQRAAFDRLRAESLEAARPTFEGMRESGRALRELLAAEKPDPTAVGERAIELHRLRGELEAARESFETELTALLTPEQRIAFDALERARLDGRRDERHGRGFGGRRGSGEVEGERR